MRYLLFAVIVAFACVACNPYPEGPNISFRSKQERLANHWKPEKVERDETNVIEYWENFSIEIEYDGDFTIYNKIGDTLDVEQHGVWDFIDDARYVRLVYTDPPVSPDRTVWEIIKLKEKEFWAKETTDSVTWSYYFIPK